MLQFTAFTRILYKTNFQIEHPRAKKIKKRKKKAERKVAETFMLNYNKHSQEKCKYST